MFTNDAIEQASNINWGGLEPDDDAITKAKDIVRNELCNSRGLDQKTHLEPSDENDEYLEPLAKGLLQLASKKNFMDEHRWE